MSQNTTSTKKKNVQKNPYEVLKNSSSNSGDIFDRLSGGNWDESEAMDRYLEQQEKPEKKPNLKTEASLFRFHEHSEKESVKRQISELADQVKKEVEALKRTQSSFIQEVNDVDKLTINSLPEKPGIYHVRFLEIVLSIVRTIRMKIGESKTWLEAMVSKKQKRGSAFAARSKRMGTQYSLSQEISNSRSVQ